MNRSRAAARLVVLFGTALFLTLSFASPAFGIPRQATLARGLTWVRQEVPYSQSRYWGGYRTDCSGFVSMAWSTGTSYNTRTFYRVTYPISADDLQPGDALLRAGYHIRLFAGWVDEAQTYYVAYEETGPGTIASVKSIASDLAYGYVPVRYVGIGGSVAPWGALDNSSFDVWSGNNPAYWTASRDASGTVSRRLRDLVSTNVYSLGIVNRSISPGNTAQVQQSAAVEASKTYSLDAYAWTNRDPSAMRMRLQMFDSTGRTLVDTSTPGSAWNMNPAGLRRMTISQVAPSGTTSATVSLMLAGGAYVATDTPGYAMFDDVQLRVTSPAPVYRFYNPGAGTHFYTASGDERDAVVGDLWYRFGYEGVAYTVPVNAANNQNLYRFFNVRNGTHFYTASDAERDTVMRTLGHIYRYEGVAYKVSRAPVPGSTAVYRFFNSRAGTHFYTAAAAERDNVINSLGWLYRYEGPVYYIAP